MTLPGSISPQFPKSPVERQRQRAMNTRRAFAEAERLARITGRSLKCGELRRHAGDSSGDGCRNDGSTCICECHDDKR